MAIQTSANNQVTVLSASWNSATTAYTALKIDVNNILTPTGSLLLDIGTNTGTYSSKFAIDVSGSVGIGTAAPGGKFEVVGTSGSLMLVTDNLSGSLFSVNDVTGLPIFEVFSDDKVVAGTVNSNALVVTGSRVGIGTNSPDVRLVVSGGSGNIRIGDVYPSYNGITLNGSTSASNYNFLSSPSDQNLFINRPSGNRIEIREANSTHVTISSGGNVGIGITANASYKLHVNGTVSAWDGTNGRVNLIPSNSSTTGYVEWRNGSGTRLGYMGGLGTSNLNVSLENSAKFLVLDGDVGIGSNSITARFQVSGSSTASTPTMIVREGVVSPTGGVGALDVQNSAGTTLFFVSGSGRVGIATSSPNARLEVNLGGSNAEILSLKTTYAADNSYHSMTWRDGSNITGQIDTRYDGTTVDMVFGSLYSSGYNSTERMRIKGSGDVGIGTSSFTGRLYVSGSSTGTTPSLLVRHGVSSGSDLPIAKFQDSAGTTRFTISGSGFVSMTGNEFQQISATNDYIAKHTFYNSGASYLGFVGYQGDASLNITNEVGRVYIAPAANYPTIVNGGAGGWVQVSASDPKVGINTNDPLYTLHIEDISASEDCVVWLNGPRAKVFSTFYADFGSDGSSGAYSGVAGAAFIRTSADPLIIQTSYVERMRITAGGDVGIGTTSITTARLHVQGGASGTDTTLRVRHGVADGSSLPVLDVQNSAGTSLLFVSGSGGVGIGTNDTGLSTVRLYVSSSLTGNAASALLIGAQSFGTSVNTSKAFTHLFQLPDGTETARITSSGNVGIGTNAAITSRLQVSGSSSVTAPAMTVRAGTAIQTGGTKVFQVLKNDGTGIFHVSGSGDVYVDNGNLIMGTSGKGIDFSAASNAASGSLSSELLDDYEEGTWTPQCSGSSGGVVNLHPSSTGAYTKVGRLVHCQFYVSASSITGTMSGYLRLFGLPFQAASTGFGSFGNAQNVEIYLGSGFSTTYAHTNVTIQASTNFGQGWYYTTSAAIVGAAPRIVAGSVFDGMFTYITDQ